MRVDLKAKHPLLAGALAALLLTGCAGTARAPSEINDPYEAQNRAIHAVNLSVDEALFKGRKANGPAARYASNIAHNLGLPGKIVNSVLQGRPEPAANNLFRFLINSTLGLGGVFDPAGNDFGLPEAPTDFGETLYVWGWGEGAYVELPLIGPSTERDTVGRIVDAVLDPVGAVASGTQTAAVTSFRLGGRISDRLRYGETVDSILYDSADSYAQSRLIYLQNRRHQLGGSAMDDAAAFDPYEDPYDQ